MQADREVPITIYGAPSLAEHMVDWRAAVVNQAKTGDGPDEYGVAVAILVNPKFAEEARARTLPPELIAVSLHELHKQAHLALMTFVDGERRTGGEPQAEAEGWDA